MPDYHRYTITIAMINWHKWTESANTIKIKPTTNKSTQQIVDSSKQYKIMNTDITKIVNVRKDVTYKSNTRKLSLAIAMIVAGIAACLLSAHVGKSNEALNMSLIVIGASAFFVGLFLALSRPKMFIYLPTGSKIKPYAMYFDASSKSQLFSLIINDCFHSTDKTIKSLEDGKLKLDIMLSEDNKFASVQLSEYIGFNYEPISETFFFCDESAKAVADFMYAGKYH